MNAQIRQVPMNQCVYCGKEDAGMHMDHVIPKCQGGPDKWSNRAPACQRCNSSKGGRDIDGFREYLTESPIVYLRKAEARISRLADLYGHDRARELVRMIDDIQAAILDVEVEFYFEREVSA